MLDRPPDADLPPAFPQSGEPAGSGGGTRPIVIVSNRGPVSFRRDDAGALVPRRGAGGLVSGLAPLVVGTDSSWIAAALSDDDRQAAKAELIEADGFRVRLLDIDPGDFTRSY